MSDKIKGIITSLLFLAFSIVMIIFAKDIKPMMKNDLGSGFFPMVVGIAMLALSVLRLIIAIVGVIRVKTGKEVVETKKSNDDILGGLATIILIGAYCLAFDTLGFIITTAIYLFLQILVLIPKEKLNLKGWLTTIAISAIAPFAFYALFVYAINTPLPMGLFGF